MARVTVYTRALDAVFINIQLDDGLDFPQCGVQIKEEPPDSDIENNTLPINTNRQNGNPSALKSEFTDHVDRKDDKSVVPQDSAHVKKQTHNQGKQNSEEESGKIIICSICFLTYQNSMEFNQHKKCYSRAATYECYKCNGLFVAVNGLKMHLKNDVCISKTHLYKYACNFCSRRYPNKKHLQSHLFHFHGDLIAAGVTESSKASATRQEKLNDSSNTTTLSTLGKKLNNQSCTIPTNSRNLNTTPSKRLNASPRRLNNWVTPSKRRGNNIVDGTPSKRLKQTILTDFISLFNSNEDEKCVVPQKSISCPNTPIFTTPNAIRKSPTSSKVTESSTTDDASNKKPFVHPHVNPNRTTSLYKDTRNKFDGSITSNDSAYNLRSVRKTSYYTRSFRNFPTPEIPNIPLEYTKKKRSTASYHSKKRRQLADEKWRTKFNCKNCVIRLERCDKINVEVANSLSPSSDPLRSLSIDVPLVKFLEFENSMSHKLITTEEETKLKKKIHQCHFCKKVFALQKDRRKHAERVHAVYVSSICNARYSSMKKLLSHYMHQHMVLNRKKCCICYEKFRNPRILKRHMVLHCVKTTRSKKDTFPVDVETHCIVAYKQHKCEACRKRFWLSSCLKEHQNVCSLRKAQAIIQKSSSVKSSKEEVAVKEEPCEEELREEEFCKEEFHEEASREEEFQQEAFREEEFHQEASREEECHEELFCTEEFREEVQKVSFEIIKVEQPVSLPENTVANNTAITPPITPVTTNTKRFNSRVARVKGYEHSMPCKAKFPCTVCGKQFQTFQNLCMHEETYCRPAVNICSTCGTAFSSKRLLQLHIISTHTPLCPERYRFFCKFCNQGFNKKVPLRSHERHFHAGHISKLLVSPEYVKDVSPVCNVCTLLFQSYERFIEHKMYYYEGQSFMCFVCDKLFNGLFNLQHHYKLEHCGLHLRECCVYRCHICGEGFNYESHFHAHKLHAHALDADILKQLRSLQDHTYAMIPNNISAAEEPIEASLKVYPCNVCALKLLSEKDLEMHRLEYSVDGDFSCNKCDRKCRTRHVLAKHQSLTHVGCDVNSSFKCRLCNEVLTTSMAMECHMKHFHENNKNYVSKVYQNRLLNGDDDTGENSSSVLACSTCGMKFSRKIDLKYHLLQYSNIGDFNCSMCQRKFVQSALLEKHKAKHYMVNLSASRCPICNLGFVTPADLRRHVLHLHPYETFGINKVIGFRKIVPKIISGIQGKSSLSPANREKETPAKCNVCNLEFIDRKALVKHQSRFSNSGKYVCPICSRRFQWSTTVEQHIRKHSTSNKCFWRYNCSQCGESFRSAVALYAHMVHIHGAVANLIVTADEIEYKSNDTDVDSGQAEPVACVDASSSDAVTEQQTIHTIDIIEDITDITEPAGDLDVYCYTCLLCNTKHLTLKKFYEHFSDKHTTSGNCRILNFSKSNSGNMKYCSICNVVLSDEESIKDHMLRVHQITFHWSSEQTAFTKADDLPKTNERDMDKISCEKKSETISYIIINNRVADCDVQTANKDPIAVNEQNNGLQPDNATVPNSSVGKLKVKAFARIQSE